MKTSNVAVLKKLRALKLKAKDGEQELNRAVVTVLKSELLKDLKTGSKAGKAAEVKEAAKKVVEKKEPAEVEAPKTTVKKATKKTAAKTAAKKDSLAEEKVPAKTTKKKTATTPVRETGKSTKPKPKKAPAPFVAVKPLAKKKKRFFQRGGKDSSAKKASEKEQPTALVSSQEIDPGSLIPLELKLPITVKDFAVRIQEKSGVVLKKLMQMGFMANINQGMDEEVLRKLAREFGYDLTEVKTEEEQLIEEHKQEEEDPSTLRPRAPVITFMGHVDHGKTSLLDKIREAKVADKEHGGITQHIGAYSVNIPKGKITFLDTPGHEAFTAMRARGAHITDIVVLVIAADEGIMPQTEEAIDHATAAGVPIVVAFNKMDRPGADPDRVKKQLAEKNLASEDWGGKTVVVGVSAVTGEGIDNLLELILLEAELLELKANPNKRAAGIVVEAHLSQGKGAVASLIVQSGTLKRNDFVVAGPYYGKLKAMFDDRERLIDEAGPSIPVEVLGLPGVPEAGEPFYVVEEERQAREITQRRQQLLKDEKLRSTQKITLEDMYSHIKEGHIKEFNIILKSDVQGSLEALKDSLAKIPSDEVKLKFIHTGLGEVNTSDVILAAASNAVILTFHVGVDQRAAEEMSHQPIDIRQYRIIYDAVNDVRSAVEGLLEPAKKRNFLARIEVRQVFKLSKSGIIAGCFVRKGTVHRKDQIDVIRDGETIYSGTIGSLKRFKDDVKEVKEGYECGISVAGFDTIQEGDELEAFEIESIARTLK